MTTATKNTLTLEDLLNAHMAELNSGKTSTRVHSLASPYKNADGSNRDFHRFNSLLNGSSGRLHWFPSCFTARESVEWEEETATFGAALRNQMVENAMSARRSFQYSSVLLIEKIFREVVELAKTNSLDDVLDAVMVKSVVSLWALSDAYALLTDGDLPLEAAKKRSIELPFEAGGTSVQSGQTVFSDVYGVGGRVLASQLWDLMVHAIQTSVAEQVAKDELERRAAKPESKAAKRKAASKARKASKKK